jgi:hypothetical protein
MGNVIQKCGISPEEVTKWRKSYNIDEEKAQKTLSLFAKKMGKNGTIEKANFLSVMK